MDESHLINCCRTCLKDSCNMRSMSTLWNDQIQFWEMLIDLGASDSRNTVPFNVCDKCEVQLISAYSFKTMCQETDLLLNKYFEEEAIAAKSDQEQQQDSHLKISAVATDDVVNIYTNDNSTTYTDVDNLIQDSSDNNHMWEESVDKEEYNSDFKIIIENNDTELILQNESIIMDSSTCILLENHLQNNEIKNEYSLDGGDQVLIHSNETIQQELEMQHNEHTQIIYVTNEMAGNSEDKYSEEISSELVSVDKYSEELSNELVSVDKYSEEMSNELLSVDKCSEEISNESVSVDKYSENISNEIVEMVTDSTINIKTDESEDYLIETNLASSPSPSTAVKSKSSARQKERLIKRKCRLCNLVFDTIKAYQLHHRLEHRARTLCPFCGKLVSKHAMEKHMVSHTKQKDHLCTECGKSFTLGENLKKHWRIHTNDKRYTCEHCGEKFIHWNSKRSHVRATHTGEKK